MALKTSKNSIEIQKEFKSTPRATLHAGAGIERVLLAEARVDDLAPHDHIFFKPISQAAKTMLSMVMDVSASQNALKALF